MNRLIRLSVLWLALVTLAACSDEETDEPPRAAIVYPEPGYHYTSAPDSMIVDAFDDRGITSVEFRLDDEVIATARTSPYSTRLPLGIYADGLPHRLDATARDTRSQRGEAGAITVTIDPSLQTVPQITSVAAAADGSGTLQVTWHPWPEAVTRYEWEIARDDGFYELAAAGSAADTVTATPVGTDGLASVRVRTVTPTETSGWSRTSRYSGLATWRERCALAGPQLGTAILTADDGTLRLLSHAVPRHRVSRAPVQLLSLDADHQLVAASTLLGDDHLPRSHRIDPAGRLVLGGLLADGVTGFLAAADLAGTLLWSVTTDQMAPTALAAADDGSLLAVGADRRAGEPGGVFAAIGEGGALTLGPTFPLAAGREVWFVWPRPSGGHVLAGIMPDDEEGRPDGVWALGLDEAGAVHWNVRLGTGQQWLLRGGGADGTGNYVLAGIALRDVQASRYGFLAGIDERGRVRWQFEDRDWHFFAEVVPTVGGRWAAVGSSKRPVGDGWEYHFALRGFSPFGSPLWESELPAGRESQGWSLVAHPGGGWWAAGTRTDDGTQYDVDLVRVDDRGALE